MVTTCRQQEPGAGLRWIADRPEPVPERLLWKLWKDRAARQEGLRTAAGRRLRILYPGRTGTAAGPDFRDALLEVEGVGLVRGDVEIHVRQRDWASHGHTNDPNYNGVVVHAALEVDTDETTLPHGGAAPVVSLAGLLEMDPQAHDDAESFDLWPILARHGIPRPETADEAGELLDRAGDARFRRKAANLRRFIREQGAEQTLYETLMEGLGYRHNRQPFLRLAYLAPFAALQRAMRSNIHPGASAGAAATAVNGWLLAVAGLGPGSGAVPPLGLRRAMSSEEWRLFRVRPSNHPVTRIRGAAALLARFRDDGPVQGLRNAASGGPAELTKALTVKSAGEPEGLPACIGTGRARELAVNAVLPFCHAQSTGEGVTTEESPYLELFRRFPNLEGNEVVREMSTELFPAEWRTRLKGARRQQGLLHLAALLRGAG
jgi:hypothetical protein